MCLLVEIISISQGSMAIIISGLAAYWKNGKMTKVTKTKTYGLPKNSVWSSRASSIHVEGGTVYMAGAVNVINAGDVPVYWKNKVFYYVRFKVNDLENINAYTIQSTK